MIPKPRSPSIPRSSVSEVVSLSLVYVMSESNVPSPGVIPLHGSRKRSYLSVDLARAPRLTFEGPSTVGILTAVDEIYARALAES
jgi:hypothetical protein